VSSLPGEGCDEAPDEGWGGKTVSQQRIQHFGGIVRECDV
jgi:hypothetical protein